MTRPDLPQMTSEEKDALTLALLKRIENLEAHLASRRQKGTRPPRQGSELIEPITTLDEN